MGESGDALCLETLTDARLRTMLSVVTGINAANAAYMPAMPRVAPSVGLAASAPRVGRVCMDGEADGDFGLELGQKYGPTAPAHPVAPGDL